ncbi:DUF302 domain-containing protein [Cobetia sp. L2A1]|uniref:DUF302 domain-containing protein n=1 Tax=Cobetia sp. L2A1 TaxID=2686360 RepID=UPI001E50B7B4|nr:DUF302 domain-containing protein [Cobetia sp. L2A1]
MLKTFTAISRSARLLALMSLPLMAGAGMSANADSGAAAATAPEVTAGVQATAHGIESLTSRDDVSTVQARLEKALSAKGLTLFTVIDHEAGAKQVGLELPATHTVIFGNPKVGTLLMQCNGSAALDLPQKMVIRAVEGGSVIEWNDPQYLANRHDLGDCTLPLDKVAGLLKGLAAEAAGQ